MQYRVRYTDLVTGHKQTSASVWNTREAAQQSIDTVMKFLREDMKVMGMSAETLTEEDG